MFKKNKDISGLIKELKKHYPKAKTALRHENPFQLTVATILSAQCTDERVNKVTPGLFQKYKTAADFATVPQEDLEKEIHSTGFYKNKAKSIRGMAQALMDRHRGKVPNEMEKLLELPGVARKTANVVLGSAFGIAAGVVVDTHVARLSGRLGLSDKEQPEKIEEDLMQALPKDDWIWFSHALILHGRQVCRARPQCPSCPVRKLCANPVK